MNNFIYVIRQVMQGCMERELSHTSVPLIYLT